MRISNVSLIRVCNTTNVKKSPVEVVQVAQYKLLMKDYANHTWFHENNILEMEDMQGN